ncbi:MAG: DUF3618 domain-containing protein [Paracoccaceae bacterium]
MAHPSDTDTIEAGIERDRASLASTLGTLQDRMSVEQMAHEALGYVRTNAAEYTRSIDNAVRSNPLALALTGIGIAWLIFGSKKSDEQEAARAAPRWDYDDPTPRRFPDGDGARSRASVDDEWSRNIDALRDQASARVQAIENEARSYTARLRAGISDGLAEARDFAAERSAALAEFAEDMKRGFLHGLDDLSDTARQTVVAARERAYAAKIRAGRMVRGGTQEAGRLIEDHPLVAGAVALALGAALAAALPRTRKEDQVFGDQSDRLMEEANRLLHRERERVARVASGVADELKEGSRSALDTVTDQVAKTAKAVKERAEDEARKSPGKAANATAKAGSSRNG